ncbi:MAG: ribosome small subunit-dependent GTPase A [Nevskia sp.]|nr:ribosome small subunit-dependent GTPase A [Nevskia sp.]
MRLNPLNDENLLRAIGWNAHCAAALAALVDRQGRPARIIEQHRGHLVVHDGQRGHKAKTLTALFDRLETTGDGLSVGDWVLIAEEGGSLYVHEHLPRASLLLRSRGDNGVQRIAANVDTALLVMALDNDFSPNRLERYLLMVRAANVAPVVILTKPDRATDIEAQRAEVAALAGPATPLFVLDARVASAQQTLVPWLAAGQTLVLLGSSGVGKSTLVNSLMGNESERTGATRAYDDRGRHTTTSRSLRTLPQGACLIDTPGVRELKLGGEEDVTADAFEDIAELAHSCRFRNCNHGNEPGCAVVAGLPPERLDNYRKLRDELAATQKRRLEAASAPMPTRRSKKRY